jgi:hypothetical protein
VAPGSEVFTIVKGPGPAGGGDVLLTSLQPANPQTYRNDSRRANRKCSVSLRRPIRDVPSKRFSNRLLTIQEISVLVFHGMCSQLSIYPTTHRRESYRKTPDAVCPTKVWRMEPEDLLCSCNAWPQKDEREQATILLARRAPTIKRWSLDARREEQSSYSLWGSWGIRRPSLDARSRGSASPPLEKP